MTKSIEFNEKNNGNNLITNSSDKNKNIFFKIYYNHETNLYYIIDMGVGYGTFKMCYWEKYALHMVTQRSSQIGSFLRGTGLQM